MRAGKLTAIAQEMDQEHARFDFVLAQNPIDLDGYRALHCFEFVRLAARMLMSERKRFQSESNIKH